MRNGMIGLVLLGVSAVLGGCAYQAQAVTTPAYNVPLSYASKIPGKWLLSVDAAAFQEEARTSSVECSFHRYPLDVSGAYRESVRQTLQNVFHEVELIDGAGNVSDLKAAGARGLIRVRAEDARVRLDVRPGFWSANMRADLEMVSSVTVDRASGRVFGQTVQGRGDADGAAGFACAGGAKAVGSAAEVAMRDNVRAVAEALGNAPRLR